MIFNQFNSQQDGLVLPEDKEEEFAEDFSALMEKHFGPSTAYAKVNILAALQHPVVEMTLVLIKPE